MRALRSSGCWADLTCFYYPLPLLFLADGWCQQGAGGGTLFWAMLPETGEEERG